MNIKQIMVGTWTRLYLPHYGCRGFLEELSTTLSTPGGGTSRDNILKSYCRAATTTGYVTGVLQEAPVSVLPWSWREENSDVSHPRLVGTFLGTSREHLARRKGSPVGGGSSPLCGRLRAQLF